MSKFQMNVKYGGQVAVQGPKALEEVEKLIPGVSKVSRFGFGFFEFEGERVVAARTGYTGEDGFEIFVPQGKTLPLWTKLIEAGGTACGLGARDSLRLEAALNLYGQELSDDCNPYERRLGLDY